MSFGCGARLEIQNSILLPSNNAKFTRSFCMGIRDMKMKAMAVRHFVSPSIQTSTTDSYVVSPDVPKRRLLHILQAQTSISYDGFGFPKPKSDKSVEDRDLEPNKHSLDCAVPH